MYERYRSACDGVFLPRDYWASSCVVVSRFPDCKPYEKILDFNQCKPACGGKKNFSLQPDSEVLRAKRVEALLIPRLFHVPATGRWKSLGTSLQPKTLTSSDLNSWLPWLVVPDACPKGWLHSSGKCYKYFPDAKHWVGAYYHCKSHGAKLATIDNGEQNRWVTKSAKIMLMRGGGRSRRFQCGLTLFKTQKREIECPVEDDTL